MTDDNMLSRERSDAELEAAKPINLSEALGDAAHKQKRNLVSWAAVAILVRYYHIDLTKILGLMPISQRTPLKLRS